MRRLPEKIKEMWCLKVKYITTVAFKCLEQSNSKKKEKEKRKRKRNDNEMFDTAPYFIYFFKACIRK